MRPVNLIPGEQRPGGKGITAGRTGIAVYIALGVLALAVLGIAMTVLTSNKIKDREAEVAGLSQETAAARSEADALRPYGNFAQIKEARVATVNSLMDTSFNWERVFRSLSRTIPSNAWLVSLKGTTSPDVKFEGAGGGGTGASRTKTKAPAVELTGCTYSHTAVARMVVRMRNLDDVSEVLLQSSEKSDTAQQQLGGAEQSSDASGGRAASGTECRTRANITKFEILVVLGLSKTATASAAAAAAAVAPTGPVAAAQGAVATASTSTSGGGQ